MENQEHTTEKDHSEQEGDNNSRKQQMECPPKPEELKLIDMDPG